MKILIKKAQLIDPNSKHDGKKVDIFIEKGIIQQISSSIKNEGNWKEVSSKSLVVSPGWFDLRSHFNDPGFEHKEDIETGLNAAAAGGFTGVATLPNTLPVRDSKSGIRYAIKHAENHVVELFPLGAISAGLNGKNLAELYDMAQAGAVAFTDGDIAVHNANLMLRALLYTKGFNGLVMNLPNEPTISLDGKVNEGPVSTQLGLKGIPTLSEELMVNRDLYLLKYTKGKLHIGPISSKSTLDQIKAAKKQKQDVTTEVALANLIYTDDDLTGFNSNYKVYPPLRTITDQKALIKGVANGDIEIISTNHHPENIENKDREFDHAAFGMTQLETFFAQYNMHLANHISLTRFVEVIALNPRKRLALPEVCINEGNKANLTLFDPTLSWTYSKTEKQSKSENSPVLNQELKGKIIGIMNGNYHTL